MASDFGKILHVSVFGQSHGKAIGAVIDGLPAGFAIDLPELKAFLARRAPGQNPWSTPRKEADDPIFLSGIIDGVTTGAPVCTIIENRDTRSSDYDELRDKPRPGHADYTAQIKWQGQADLRGGGHFSGRITAPLCIVGGIARQILASHGVHIGAHLAAVGEIRDEAFPLEPTAELFRHVAAKAFPVVADAAGERMKELILAVAAEEDSIGGVIECAAVGLPAGVGSPMFEGMENRLAQALFGIPAIKGLEFGSGFAGSQRRGSENNDPYAMADGKITTVTNHAGGILGGITTGRPVTLRVAVKPTASIGKAQQTVSLGEKTTTQLKVVGRHDPCIALRAVPVVEAVTALVLLDLLMEVHYIGIN